jgi:hypothetical protein
MSCHLKLVFEEVIFSSNIIKTPQVLKRGSMQKKKKKKKKKKNPRVFSNKRGSQYFERRKILQLQRSFLM